MKPYTKYEEQFDFVKKCLDYHKIAYHTYLLDHNSLQIDDLGIRDYLGFTEENLESIKTLFQQSILTNTLSYLTDELSCHYILFPLPGEHLEQIFVIGPYITSEEKDIILTFMNRPEISAPWLPILKNHYFQICSLANEDMINSLVITLAEYIWGENNYQIHHSGNGLPDTISMLSYPSEPQNRMDLFSDMDLIEALYFNENELINAISCGQSTKARVIFNNLPLNTFKNEWEPMRNIKNFTIINNTLFRKAAEQGGVHPLYIDQLSNMFLNRIEKLKRSDNIFDFWTEMIQKYCSLVNNQNTRNYSLPIQKAVTKINFDISADLSLNTLSEYLNINASYLSDLFKKETGKTLTYYVNKKRMEHAAFLLSTTAQPVSSISQQCGILDNNYFTKLFKRHYHMTPSTFRNNISKNL